MKNKKKIIIVIAVIVVAIIAVIVGISVNKHQKAVKESEAVNASVEASKNDLISSYKKQYQTIVSTEYKTEAEYTSAKKSLSSLKEEIEKSNVKDDNEIAGLIKDINDAIKNCDDKINSFTTTTTTEAATEQVTKKPIKDTNVNKVTTTKKHEKPKGDSGSKVNKKPAETTTKKHVAGTTTKKVYKPDPPYGYATTKDPDINEYAENHWYGGTVTYIWYESEGMWGSKYEWGSASDDWRFYASKAAPTPNRDGKYDGEEVSTNVWVWMG